MIEHELKFDILFTAPAVYDLRKIKTYLDGVNPSIFYTLMKLLKKKMLVVEKEPYIASVFLVIQNKKYRRIIIKGYVFIYDIDETEQIIYIDRIFHQRENYYYKLF